MSTRAEILKVALERGWEEDPGPLTGFLFLSRYSGGERYRLVVEFSTSGVHAASIGTGSRIDVRLYGGRRAVLAHLRQFRG